MLVWPVEREELKSRLLYQLPREKENEFQLEFSAIIIIYHGVGANFVNVVSIYCPIIIIIHFFRPLSVGLLCKNSSYIIYMSKYYGTELLVYAKLSVLTIFDIVYALKNTILLCNS